MVFAALITLATWSLGWAQNVQVQTTVVMRVPAMDVNYQLAGDETQIESVQLWYAQGYDGPWQLFDYDQDHTSPVKFNAPGEGLYRLLVVAVDRWGRSSYQSPSNSPVIPGQIPTDVPAHQIVFIDCTAPELYLTSPRVEFSEYRQDNLLISWAGFDANLDAQPVRLYYQQPGLTTWIPLDQKQPAGGQVNWTIPAEIAGKLKIKVEITDQAGNVTTQESALVNVTRPAKPLQPINIQSDTASVSQPSPQATSTRMQKPEPETIPAAAVYNAPDTNVLPAPVGPSSQALLAFARAGLHLQRHEWAQAALAYREALDYEPKYIEARINLAGALYEMQDYEQARRQFKLALEQDPTRSSALFNLARTELDLQLYADAQNTLTTLLNLDRRDWQGWLLHGLASVNLGQLDTALSSWRIAARGDLPEVAEQARQYIDQYQP